MKQNYLTFSALLVGVAMLGITGSEAREGIYQARSDGAVTACSRYGNYPCYSARLRKSVHGKQLVLRHGTRIDCGRDCENTLREATVDFWDTMRENGG